MHLIFEKENILFCSDKLWKSCGNMENQMESIKESLDRVSFNCLKKVLAYMTSSDNYMKSTLME